ncbi:MAG: P-loop NTPase [Micrococcaceae bacterium]
MALPPHLRPTNAIQALDINAKKIIAVTSGKGGVGKSTVTALLASDYARKGFKVGIVDLDVFGFSIPKLFKITEKAKRAGTLIKPVEVNGLYLVSMGMFVNENEIVAWRGPMLHRAVHQLLNDVAFPELDYLFLDLPPGTGDIAISMGQLLPQAKVLIVTTPQPHAADISIRTGLLAKKNDQEVIGVIENMSHFITPDGKAYEIFGANGGKKIAEELDAELLTKIPIVAETASDKLITKPDIASPVLKAIAKIKI